MAVGDLQGFARTNSRSPVAKGECDRCRFWWPLDSLRRQYQWRGTALADTGFLVCRRCLDEPQEQYRTIILPGDPIPRVNPRPSPDVTGYATAGSVAVPTNPENRGFSQYVLGSPTPGDYPNPLSGHPPMTSSAIGKAAVLAQVAQLSGIPTPTQALDYSTIIGRASLSQTLMIPQAPRSWVLIYNPADPQVQISLAGAAFWGMTTNLIIGPGEAFFWSTSQGLGAAYRGAVSIVGLFPGMPLWAWQSAAPALVLTDDLGNPVTDDQGNWILLEESGAPTNFLTTDSGLVVTDDLGNPVQIT